MTHLPRSAYFRTSKKGIRHRVSSSSVSRYDWTRSNHFSSEISAKKFDFEKAGRTACFVNPNARCPVCGAEVYYYQNERGSRVFFDEIGRPWPKHPCTDRASQFEILDDKLIEKSATDRNAKLEAAAAVGFDFNDSFANKFGQSPWHLLKIIKCFRERKLNLVAAESLEDLRRSYFQFESRKRDIQKGDIVAKKGSRITYLDLSSLEPRETKVIIIRRLHDFFDKIPNN